MATNTHQPQDTPPADAGGAAAQKGERNRLIMEEHLRILAAGDAPQGKERDIVRTFLEMTSAGHFDERLPQAAEDTIICEQCLKYGRADIVIYHLDGSVSVIEVKDGSYGYSHVVSGIGQTTLYAVQIASARGAVTVVRRCLMWSSTGDAFLDGVIEEACERAGVVALPMVHLQKMMAIRVAAERLFHEGVVNGSAQEG